MNTAQFYELIARNTVRNAVYVEDNHTTFLGEQAKSKSRGPALIVGSGPSLDDALPLIDKWDGPVFTGNGNALSIARWGKEPDYVCILDPANNVLDTITGREWKETILLCSQFAHNDVLRYWKWEKQIVMVIVKKDPFFTEICPIIFPDTRHAFLYTGCVTNMQVQIAYWMGFDPLIFVGVDYGYTDNRIRSTCWKHERMEWHQVPEKQITLDGKNMLIPENYGCTDRTLLKQCGILTTREMIVYKNTLLAIYALDKPNIINCSRGILTDVFTAENFSTIIDNQYCLDRYCNSDNDKKEITEKYFSSTNMSTALPIDMITGNKT